MVVPGMNYHPDFEFSQYFDFQPFNDCLSEAYFSILLIFANFGPTSTGCSAAVIWQIFLFKVTKNCLLAWYDLPPPF